MKRASVILAGCLLWTCASAHEAIVTEYAPPAVGPYSQGILAGDTLHVAGQIALDVATGTVPGDIELQTERVLQQIRAIVEASGMTMANVVATTVYLADLDDFSRMNTVYAQHFPDPAPARSTVEAARLPRDALIEISAVAIR
ncbi:MAG: RidA family protein [Gammaproteobacteria bacterium]|nr:MAG: RidA family protein [Gammaproteobacteria bacterium]